MKEKAPRGQNTEDEWKGRFDSDQRANGDIPFGRSKRMTSKTLQELLDINGRIERRLILWKFAVADLDKEFSLRAFCSLKDSFANIRIALDRADKVCEQIFVERGKVQ